jgi:hypothetical protein
MNIQQRLLIGVVIVGGFIFFSKNEPVSTDYGLQSDEVQSIMDKTLDGFVKAEKDVFDEKSPTPPNPDIPLKPDPDPNKCICQGTGKIEQGDGHYSPCPYHGKSNDKAEVPTVQPSKIEYVPPPVQYSPPTQRRGIFGGRLFNRS